MPSQPIYEILNSLMEERGYSIAETSRLSGLSDSTVRGIITRKQKRIDLEVAFCLAKAFNVPLEVFKGDTIKKPSDLTEGIKAEVMATLRQMDPQDVEYLVVFAQFLLSRRKELTK